MDQIRWRKSSRSSGNNGQCVELAHTLTVVRDSKNPAGPTLVGRIDALVAAVKNGSLGH
ncbi:DUF397 domain-containing protein [Actinokineospora cianjurensis]|uniref:Uncharacterized protein DUF397 n=1 Tax=Actinokineospora cianjurensis TaxID=585224 RepID=A0A421AWZ7_9PSEU|nr:DUF397 domain-containing protein [Actinokineospora cianjurensis]RLK54350.1 uncharacterized protein DUF397 [Actinokineospora cianjurensis]